MLRRHALDGVAVFVHVEHTAFHGQAVQGVGPHFPVGVKHRRVAAVHHLAETLFAAQVVHTVHECSFK